MLKSYERFLLRHVDDDLFFDGNLLFRVVRQLQLVTETEMVGSVMLAGAHESQFKWEKLWHLKVRLYLRSHVSHVLVTHEEYVIEAEVTHVGLTVTLAFTQIALNGELGVQVSLVLDPRRLLALGTLTFELMQVNEMLLHQVNRSRQRLII